LLLQVQQATYQLFQTLTYDKLSHSFHFPELLFQKVNEPPCKKLKNCLAHEVKAKQDYKALTRLWLPSVCHFYNQMNVRNKQMSATFISITFPWRNSKSPQKIKYRSRKDLQQKQSQVVRKVITAKGSRQKPQGFAAKASVTRSLGDRRKGLTTEAARIRSKSNRYLFVRRSPQKTHDRSRKDSQQKQSLLVCKAITARLTTEAARIRSKSNR